VQVPPRGRLETHFAFDHRTVDEMDGFGCQVRIEVVHDDPRHPSVVEQRDVTPQRGWHLLQADLGRWSDQEIEIALGIDCTSSRGRRSWSDAALWSVPLLFAHGPHPGSNVLLVTVDTLRADHLHAYGYPRETSPSIDALAERGVLFQTAETPQSATWPALTSLHTSLYPSAHGVVWNGHDMPEGLVTLADLLRSRGYSTSAFLANMKQGRHPGFDIVARSFAGGQSAEDRELTEAAVAQLGLERDRPFFLWLHLIGPHASYEPPPPWDTAFTGPRPSDVGGGLEELARIREAGRQLSPAEVNHVVGLYDGEIGHVDALVGRVLETLRELDLERSTLLAFTADHGEDLHQHHRYFFHSPSMYGSSLHVPLILAFPGVLPEGAATEQPASLVDLSPTILGLLGLPVPPSFQGHDLLPGGQVPGLTEPRALFSETNGRIYGVQRDGWRLVLNPGGEPPGAPGGVYPIEEVELYDLRQDPDEQENLADRQPETVKALAAEIQEWRDRTHLGEIPSQEMDPERLEELRALGYVFE